MVTFRQFLEDRQLLLFEPNPEDVVASKIISPKKKNRDISKNKFFDSDYSKRYDTLADRGGMSHKQIIKALGENNTWSEYNYRFGEDRKSSCKKSKKLRKKFGIQLNMPGDDEEC